MSAPDQIDIALGDVPAVDAFGLSLLVEGAEVLETIAATGPGAFRSRRRRDDAPVACLGQFAPAGRIIGFLQRGPLLLAQRMPCDGWVLASAPDGARVEHGSPLFRIVRATGAVTP